MYRKNRSSPPPVWECCCSASCSLARLGQQHAGREAIKLDDVAIGTLTALLPFGILSAR